MNRDRFINKLYCKDKTQDIIQEIPITAPWALSEWREYFFKWSSFGYFINDQNLLQSYVDNNTHQANRLQTALQIKEHLQQLLQKQEVVLAKLESQVEVVNPPPSAKRTKHEKLKKSSSSDEKSFSIEEGDSSKGLDHSQNRVDPDSIPDDQQNLTVNN